MPFQSCNWFIFIYLDLVNYKIILYTYTLISFIYFLQSLLQCMFILYSGTIFVFSFVCLVWFKIFFFFSFNLILNCYQLSLNTSETIPNQSWLGFVLYANNRSGNLHECNHYFVVVCQTFLSKTFYNSRQVSTLASEVPHMSLKLKSLW